MQASFKCDVKVDGKRIKSDGKKGEKVKNGGKKDEQYASIRSMQVKV
jgi:hypothetical protein